MENNSQTNLNEKEQTLDIDKLTLKQAKELVKELITENEDLKLKLDESTKKQDDFKDKWVRGAAEFENFRKRTALARLQGEEEGKADIILKILPIGDNLERAQKMQLDDSTKEGIDLLIKGFKEVLAKENIEEINPLGEKFDPNYHDALMQCPSEKEGDGGTVKQVLLKGYKLKDKVIRYAQVQVVCD